MRRLYTDNSQSSLASGITNSATSLSLVSGGGALFPNPNSALLQNFTATLVKNGDPSTYEIILVSQRSTDTFATIVRGWESTTPLAWSAGDFVYGYLTAGDMQQCSQLDDTQAQPGNFSFDVGSANAYSVTLTPALISHVTGMPIRWKAAHGSTGACTFNDGTGVVSMVNVTGGVPVINTNGIYTTIWDGSLFRVQQQDLSSYLTIASAAGEYAPLISPPLSGIPTAPTAAPGTSTNQIATCDFAQIAATGEQSIANSQYSYVTADGLYIVKGGIIANGGSGATPVTFNTAFPTAVMSVVSQCTNVQGTIEQASASVSGFTSTNGASGSSTYWQAVGY